MTPLRETCTFFDADDVETEKMVKKDVCLINMKRLSCTKKNTTINTTLLPLFKPLLPSSPPCTTLMEGGELHRPCRTTSIPTTTLTPTRRGSALRRRRGGVTLFVPCFYGNVLVPLVLLLLSMLIVVVESYSQLPNGNGINYASGRIFNTLNRIVDDWLDTNKRPGIEATYGPIGDWEVSLAQNFKSLFYNKRTFNEDISKWNVAAAENMRESECSSLKRILFGSVVLFFLFSGSMYSFFAKLNFLTVLFF